jgi:hypothetical protein
LNTFAPELICGCLSHFVAKITEAKAVKSLVEHAIWVKYLAMTD